MFQTPVAAFSPLSMSMINDVMRDAFPLNSWTFWRGRTYAINKPDSGDALAAIVETIERFWIAVARLPKVMR
jgi:hypothetical protein